MKVAIIQERVDLRRGGAETSTREMARHLSQLGLEVTIVHSADRQPNLSGESFSSLPIQPHGSTRLARTRAFIRAASELVRAQRFDVVHTITPCPGAGLYQPRGGTYRETISRNLALSRPAWRPVKRLLRRLNLRQRYLWRLEEQLLAGGHHGLLVAAVSDYVRRQVVSGLGFPANRVRVVYNGVDVDPSEDGSRIALRASLGVPAARPLVLFVAHNFRLKGLRELIQALAHGQSDWTLAVVGRGNPGPYRRLARRLGVASRVHFLGLQSGMNAWYAAADLLAHPTWYDPCSRVVLEALSLGLPVVTTRYNGAAEVMQTGRHGAVIDRPDDIPALAAAMETALQPAVREACQAEAPRLRARLSMARHAREMMELYEQVLA